MSHDDGYSSWEPKVAIVHYWLMSMRGGEKVVEQLCFAFPEADIFTLIWRPEHISPTIRSHKVTTSFLQRLPFAERIYQNLLPLMPLAVEQFDLNDYDIVITSDTNVTKGVLTRPGTLHICYCHTPMRYGWDMYFDYLKTAGRLKRFLIVPIMSYLRLWDYCASGRVDHFLANSTYVAKRIRKHYRRASTVIYPPVNTGHFLPSTASGDYYLALGQLVPYKRIDLAVDAFNQSGRKLVIIGEGSEYESLRAKAKPHITFLGRQPFSDIKRHYAACKGFIFPGEEDFGITPLEAQASGKPVVAYARGGALETVKHGETGILFEEQTPEALNRALDLLEGGGHAISPEKCRRNAERFSESRFREEMKSYVQKAWALHREEEHAFLDIPRAESEVGITDIRRE